MAGESQTELVELDGLLALASAGVRLDAGQCGRLVELAALAPGRRARVVRVLAEQRDGVAIDALLRLPGDLPGRVEGVFRAMRGGVAREGAPRMVALEFRNSRSKRFPGLVERAHASFGGRLERLRLGDVLHYRVAVFDSGRLSSEVADLELDLERIHQELLRIRGVRLWLNGWCFDDHSPLRPAARVPVLRGWLDWAVRREPGRAS